ncbi:MAG: hypothetical protein COT43_03625 [Candidatus Marinimicrobia bacterium CG08_land_8_20_14_0_20_45_22]|nr:MAG: hypothetical protein COT43_03625 [Candidatus Marinimicrobia bacterium CG08_land_8_20_14_0_20_45_22]
MKTMTAIFRLFVVTGAALVWFSCQKELDLTQFRDDFGDYEPEVRIEAILTPWRSTHPDAFVRIDRSITIDDTLVFNGRDDNNNWKSYSDENGNGKWDISEPLNDDLGEDGIIGQENGFPARDKGEGNGKPDQGEPNVDEYEEVLPFVHDTTAIVSLADTRTMKTWDFKWYWNRLDARYIEFDLETQKEGIPNIKYFRYGAYTPSKPMSNYPDTASVYEFKIELPEKNLVITGQTKIILPVKFLDSNYLKVRDTLYVPYGDNAGVFWTSDLGTNIYCVAVERVCNRSEYLIYDHPNVANSKLTIGNGGIPVGFEPISSELTQGLYKMTVTVLDENYGRYYYSSLLLRDPEKSNLRDQYGRPVMGVAGSLADNSIYIRVLPELDDLNIEIVGK